MCLSKQILRDVPKRPLIVRMWKAFALGINDGNLHFPYYGLNSKDSNDTKVRPSQLGKWLKPVKKFKDQGEPCPPGICVFEGQGGAKQWGESHCASPIVLPVECKGITADGEVYAPITGVRHPAHLVAQIRIPKNWKKYLSAEQKARIA